MVLEINTHFTANIIVLDLGEKTNSETKLSVWICVSSTQTEVLQGIPSMLYCS